eukprot:SAG11_NODE_8421_length_1017_cov_1.301743_1_plen_154_part_00
MNDHQAMMTDIFASTSPALRVKPMPARMREAKTGFLKRSEKNGKLITKAVKELARYKQEKARWEEMKAKQTPVEDVELIPVFARVGQTLSQMLGEEATKIMAPETGEGEGDGGAAAEREDCAPMCGILVPTETSSSDDDEELVDDQEVPADPE